MQGATVLDVGCGTGILSMFAAEGGAAKIIGMHTAADCVASIALVMCCRMFHYYHQLCSSHIAGKSSSARRMSYTTSCFVGWHLSLQPAGVDGSTRIADVAERLVAANGLASSGGGPITIMRGRLEQLPSLPVEQVCTQSGQLLSTVKC